MVLSGKALVQGIAVGLAAAGIFALSQRSWKKQTLSTSAGQTVPQKVPAPVEKHTETSANMVYHLTVEVTACNVKKIDPKAYGVEKIDCWVVLELGSQKVVTTTGRGLDPVWETNYHFEVQDPLEKLKATFFMDSVQKLQIGDTQEFFLDKLVKGKPTYKAVIVPGGKVDMMFTAVDFGADKAPETDAGGLDLLGDDDEGGMMMDSDDEEEEEEEESAASSGSGDLNLTVEVTACNVKRIDPKAYGVETIDCWVILELGDQKVRTTTGRGLDPVWETDFKFKVKDPSQRLKATFYMDSKQELQIGDTQEYMLDLLVKGKPTYKAVIVPGGKVDMMFTAVDFGADKAPETDAGGLDLLGDDEEGGMMMDSDEEEEEEEEAAAPSSSGSGDLNLTVEVTACNVKRIDPKAYGVETIDCWVILELGDQKVRTTTGRGLDPVWETDFKFKVKDPSQRLKATFYMDSKQELQIGDTQEYMLDLLVRGKPTYKAVIVPGGKVDMMFTAVDFGADKAPETDAGGLDLLGDDDEGGMMMDSDEEEEEEEEDEAAKAAAAKEAAEAKAKEEKKAAKAAEKDAKAAEKAAKDKAKAMKAVVKEGGKKGVEIAGAADMGGLEFFCSNMMEPKGSVELLIASMHAMNKESDPEEEEMKGGSGHVGKMIFSASEEGDAAQVVAVAYVPADKQGKIDAKEWMEHVLAQYKPTGALTGDCDSGFAVGVVKHSPEAGRFLLKDKDSMLPTARDYLKSKNAIPEKDADSDDDMGWMEEADDEIEW